MLEEDIRNSLEEINILRQELETAEGNYFCAKAHLSTIKERLKEEDEYYKQLRLEAGMKDDN